ncbi:hypothetical protein SLS56_005245, partial [Neofusicoccum ribis]
MISRRAPPYRGDYQRKRAEKLARKSTVPSVASALGQSSVLESPFTPKKVAASPSNQPPAKRRSTRHTTIVIPDEEASLLSKEEEEE